MSGNDIIERCALIADGMIAELEKLKEAARTGQLDRRSKLEIDYAIRSVRRVAERIRALKSVAE